MGSFDREKGNRVSFSIIFVVVRCGNCICSSPRVLRLGQRGLYSTDGDATGEEIGFVFLIRIGVVR